MVSKAQKVIEFQSANPSATPADIAAALGIKRQYVHSVMYMQRKKAGAIKRKPGRPRKVAVKVSLPAVSVPTPQENHTLRLERELAELKTVIRYLEGKLYGASV